MQRFPRGLNSSRADSVNHTATGFPTFQLKSPSNDSNLAYLMFGGYMLGDRSKVFGRLVILVRFGLFAFYKINLTV